MIDHVSSLMAGEYDEGLGVLLFIFVYLRYPYLFVPSSHNIDRHDRVTVLYTRLSFHLIFTYSGTYQVGRQTNADRDTFRFKSC